MRKLALGVLYHCGIFSLTRAISGGMARVLMYHNFCNAPANDPNALNSKAIRDQFQYLRKHFRVVPLIQLVEQLSTPKGFDRYAVALTIDDGRYNCYECLFPLLKEFEIPATFFVVTSFIAGRDWLWTDKVLWLSEQTNRPRELAPDQLSTTFGRLNRLRPEVRNREIAAMASAMGVSIPDRPPTKYSPCSWRQLREMADSGLVEIGSHTVNHPILSSVTDEESWSELTESRRQIEQNLGREVRSFCFPNGMPGDYRPNQVKQVGDSGYLCSVVADQALIRGDADRYRLPRIGMGRKSKAVEIAKYLDGAAYYQSRLEGFFRPRVKVPGTVEST